MESWVEQQLMYTADHILGRGKRGRVREKVRLLKQPRGLLLQSELRRAVTGLDVLSYRNAEGRRRS